MKLTRQVRIFSPLGLHARPATAIARLLQEASSDVHFYYDDRTANGRSVIELLMLAAKQGAVMQVVVEGADANLVMDRLMHLVEHELGEPQPLRHV